MGWVHDTDSEADVIAKGWVGVQSFLRSIWLDKNQKQLLQWPIEEIEMLHENEVIEGGSLHETQGITASQADVKMVTRLGIGR
uniref:Glycosyl hydrolase family 32 N-terminal domain-containing protein n=1 Tax=Lactuca sativa TaxID=4236 RepID=A0A9R1VY82_LACSA|nr:hypothetical protein LSAT_V11C400170620 [Lactuca sativa]